MDATETLCELRNLRTLLDEALQNLTPEESRHHLSHLTRLRHALDLYEKSFPTPPRTFFDMLPDHAMENIIRHISDRPRSLDWPSFLKPLDAQSLYCTLPPLSTTFRKLFSSVDLTSDALTPPRKPPATSTLSPSPPFFAMPLLSRTWTSGAVSVLTSCGASITAIRYTGDRQSDPAPHLVNWIAPLRAHCTRLHKLDISALNLPFFEMVIRHASPTLTSLILDAYCSSPAHLDVIARHRPPLEHISLSQVKSAPTLLWKSIGSTLHSLEISLLKGPPPPPHAPLHAPGPAPVSDALRGVEDHCRHLTCIRVPGPTGTAHAQIARLLRSYGEQLLSAAANFASFPSDMCRNVATACPNAVFEFPATKRVATVHDLRFQIRALVIEDENAVTPADADLIAANCAALTTVVLRNLEWQAPVIVVGLLGDAKPALEDLTIALEQDNAPQVLEEIAARTGAVKRFKLTVRALEIDGFERFFAANRALEKIELSVIGSAKQCCVSTVTHIVALAARLLQEVREIVVTGPYPAYSAGMTLSAWEMARVADACVPLRKRKTHVHVFGVDYL